MFRPYSADTDVLHGPRWPRWQTISDMGYLGEPQRKQWGNCSMAISGKSVTFVWFCIETDLRSRWVPLTFPFCQLTHISPLISAVTRVLICMSTLACLCVTGMCQCVLRCLSVSTCLESWVSVNKVLPARDSSCYFNILTFHSCLPSSEFRTHKDSSRAARKMAFWACKLNGWPYWKRG